MDLVQSKINACKFDYEFLGKSISELAHQYDFPAHCIEEEIETQGWERKIEPTQLPDTRDMQEFADALETMTRSKLSIISLFRQIDHQPLIAQLETAFLNKALDLVNNLDSFDDKAATKLSNLVKAVNQIQERNPIDLAKQLSDQLESGGGKVVVNIANQLQ